MGRNVTVVLSEEAARWLRVEAARQDLSVSRFLGRLVDRERRAAEHYAEAQQRFLARRPRRLGPVAQPLPSRSSLHER